MWLSFVLGKPTGKDKSSRVLSYLLSEDPGVPMLPGPRIFKGQEGTSIEHT